MTKKKEFVFENRGITDGFHLRIHKEPPLSTGGDAAPWILSNIRFHLWKMLPKQETHIYKYSIIRLGVNMKQHCLASEYVVPAWGSLLTRSDGRLYQRVKQERWQALVSWEVFDQGQDHFWKTPKALERWHRGEAHLVALPEDLGSVPSWSLKCNSSSRGLTPDLFSTSTWHTGIRVHTHTQFLKPE